MLPMAKRISVLSECLILCFLMSSTLRAEDWLTFGHDPQRTGWAPEEKTLSIQNVQGLELKWKVHLENEPLFLNALTAPIVASQVNTPQGAKTLVYVAGTSDHFFALEAETGKVVWSLNFETYSNPKNPGLFLCPQGINATPTIDRATATIYAIAADGELFGLDLGTGKVKFGPVQFVPPFSKNWSLNLVDGVLYTSLSQSCGGAPSGISSLDTRDAMRPVIRHLFFERSFGAGVWGRGGPVAGKNGRIYAATGDGPFNPSVGDFGSSVVAASLSDLRLVDYYTPVNWYDVTRYDLDMGSGSPVWFAYQNYNLLATGGKEGVLYLMDADSLGDKDHQTPLFVTPRLANDENRYQENGIWGAPSTWRDETGQAWVYIPIWGPVSKNAPSFPANNGPHPNGCIMAFRVALHGALQKPFLEPVWISSDLRVPDPAVIANGVVLVLSTGENTHQVDEHGSDIHHGPKLLTEAEREQQTTHAVLHALDAKTGKELYESGGAMTNWVHFSGLAVADGRVFAVDHSSQVYCFGLKGK